MGIMIVFIITYLWISVSFSQSKDKEEFGWVIPIALIFSAFFFFVNSGWVYIILIWGTILFGVLRKKGIIKTEEEREEYNYKQKLKDIEKNFCGDPEKYRKILIDMNEPVVLHSCETLYKNVMKHKYELDHKEEIETEKARRKKELEEIHDAYVYRWEQRELAKYQRLYGKKQGEKRFDDALEKGLIGYGEKERREAREKYERKLHEEHWKKVANVKK